MSELEDQQLPKKKKPKTIRQQCAEDMAAFQDKLTATFTAKFDRLEQVMSAMATRSDTGPPRMVITTQAEVHPEPPIIQPVNIQDTVPKPPQALTAPAPVSFIENNHQLPQTQPAGKRTLLATDTTSRIGNEAAALNSDVNTDPSPAWIISQALAGNQGPNLSVPPPQPTSATGFQYDEEMEAKVNQILTSTAHHLAIGAGKTGVFPHKCVSRGPDRKRPAFNTLLLSEHVWGIFMIMQERKVPNDVKPCLYNHIKNIIEDTCAFDWSTAVRPWSEEIFSQVNEGRLSWHDTPTIQMLRMSMSRSPVAKIDPSVSVSGRHVPTQENKNTRQYDRSNFKQNQQAQPDILKGGPPCDAFNSAQGCNLNSGHFVKGQRMIHVCKYCLYNTSASHQHSEANCRNKGRFGPHHF